MPSALLHALFSVLLLLMTSVSPASASEPIKSPDKDVIRVLIGSAGTSPYSETAPGIPLSIMNAAVQGQLFQTDASFDLKPGLINDWHWDFKRKVYVLKLKPGLYFHNGRAVTVADLEFSLVRGFFTQHRTFYKTFLGNVEGISQAEKRDHYTPGAISGVKVVGPDSVEVSLRHPNPSFLHSLIAAYFSLVPIEEMNLDYVSWKRFPIGAGPYRVIEGFANGKVVLEKTSSAPTSAPKRVEFYTNPDAAERFDISCIDFAGFNSHPFVSEKTKLPASVTSLFFSNINPLSKNVAFRQAVAHAVDRKALASDLHDLVPTYEMLPSHFWGRADLADSYDPAKAKALLSELSKDLLAKEWIIPVFSGPRLSPEHELIVKRLKAQFAVVGFKVSFKPNPEKFISETTARASPVLLSGFVSDYVDPLIMFAAFREDSPFTYLSTINDAKFEALYNQAAASQEKEDRVTTIRTLSQYVSDQAIAVPLMERYITRYYDPKVIASLGDQSEPLTLFIDRVVVKNSQ